MMSGVSKKDDASGSQSNGPGGALGVARQEKGLDLGQTAKMLHLTAETVQHLENNAYSELPARVFIRGYLRNYARLVDLPEKQILNIFDQSCPDQECVQVLPSVARGISVEVRSSHAIVRLVTWVIVIGVVVSVGYALQDTALVAWNKIQTLGDGSLLKFEDDAASGDLLIPLLDEKSGIKLVAIPMGSTRAAGSVMPATTPTEEFVIHFTGSVWVDIRDQSGKFRLTGDMDAGSSRPLQGTPPYTVMVSDYKQVAITVNDSAYDLGPHLDNLGADELHLQFVVP